MMKRLLIAVGLLGALCFPAHAQQMIFNARIVSSCGGLSLTAGGPFTTTMDTTGNLCTSGISSSIPAGTNIIGYVSNDPCAYGAKTNVPISTSSGTTAVVAGVSAKKIYICNIFIIAATAVSVSLSEGSSSTCGTSNQAGVIGVATNGTAANGMSLAANAGWAQGSGSGSIAVTATAANYLCIFQSGTAQLAGNLTYVQQ